MHNYNNLNLVYHAMIGMAATLGQIKGCIDTKEHVLKVGFVKLQELWTLNNLLKLSKSMTKEHVFKKVEFIKIQVGL